jgi:2-dehydropantoate 2-reductase
MEMTRQYYIQPTIVHKPSMMIDVENGRPIEVEVILGSMIRLGRKLGVPLPVSNFQVFGWILTNLFYCEFG